MELTTEPPSEPDFSKYTRDLAVVRRCILGARERNAKMRAYGAVLLHELLGAGILACDFALRDTAGRLMIELGEASGQRGDQLAASAMAMWNYIGRLMELAHGARAPQPARVRCTVCGREPARAAGLDLWRFFAAAYPYPGGWSELAATCGDACHDLLGQRRILGYSSFPCGDEEAAPYLKGRIVPTWACHDSPIADDLARIPTRWERWVS